MRTIRSRTVWMLPALLLAVATACSDDVPTGPATAGDGLSADEAEFLAEETDRALDGVLGGLLGEATATAPAASAEPAGVPVTTTFTFERTRPCPEGGQIVVEGSGERVVDRELGNAEMTVEGTKTIDACAFARTARDRDDDEEGDVIIYTINGRLEFNAHWLRENHELAEAEKNVVGGFTIETNDGRTKECTVELHTVFHPETNSVTVTGQICDRIIDHTWSRDGRGRDDREGGNRDGDGGEGDRR